MSTCRHCGAPVVHEVKRGPLLVRSDPPEAFWSGKRLKVAPGEARILFQLARGWGSNASLEMLCTRDTTNSPKAIPIRMSKLRQRLTALDVPLAIESVRGWGYRFKDEEPR
jgi:DNA-binding response OmpR family regulator